MSRDRLIIGAAAVILLILVAGAWLLWMPAPPRAAKPMDVPWQVGGWWGQTLPLSHHERDILAPARLVSRIYRPNGAQADNSDAWRVVWLNVLQSDSVGKLHNFYDSLVASGLRPEILGRRVLRTAKGTFRATLIRYHDPRRGARLLLIWYQWPGGSAPDRWAWYAEILRLRAQRCMPVWQLVELATPVTRPDQPVQASEDLQRLEGFARSFYEQTLD